MGEAYDSQAEHLLRGDPGVDVEAIRHEAMIVDGKVRMYFGPFPAFLRIPLNLVYPAGRGMWSRISGFCAGTIALFAFAGLVQQALRSSPISSRARNWVGNACLIGFAFGSPLFFLLGNLSIYNEAIIWGFAWSLGALFFACRARNAEGRELTLSLLGFSLCVGAALLARITFGLPLLLIVPLLAFRLGGEQRWLGLSALLLPVGATLAFHLLLSYARFGNFVGASYEDYVGSAHREFVQKHGILRLGRVPYSFADYFSLRPPPIQDQAPFLKGDRHSFSYPSLYSLPFSETYLSVLWCSAWLVLGTTVGIVLLLRPGRSDVFDRWIAAALFSQFICILAYFCLAQRYSVDLYPFLIFCFLIFLRWGGTALLRSAMIGLVAVSIIVNSLATVSWLVDADQNVPAQTRAIWSKVLGRTPSPARNDSE